MARTRRSVWAIAALSLGLVLLAVAALGLVFSPREAPGIQLKDAREPSVARTVAAPTTLAPRAGAPRQHAPVARHRPTKPAPVARSTRPATRPVEKRPKPLVPVVDPNVTPLAVRIPSVGITSPLIRLGLNPDHTLQVPDNFALAGWYIYRPVPGNPGPAVIAGHVDSKRGPAVFYRLRDVPIGATVEVDRSDHSVAVFTVTAKEQHPKTAFPTARVYGPTTGAELRVITCGGTFNRAIGHYNDNIIVFAKLSKIVR
jgi:sortase (surface protein transpeptidase)